MRGTWLLVCLLGVPLSGCGNESTEVTPASAPGTLSDRQIVGILAELSLGAIHQARAVQDLAATAEVRALAQRFVAEDQVALDTLLAATPVTPGASDLSVALVHQLIDNLNRITAAQGLAMDVTWLCIELLSIQAILPVLDDQLTPQATDPIVLTAVQQARALIVLHQQELAAVAEAFHLRYGVGPAGPFCAPAQPAFTRAAPSAPFQQPAP